MTTPIHRLIKHRREQLGIGIAELARRIGVPTSEYWDVELYDDELTVALPLENVRALAAILGFDLGILLRLGSLVGWPTSSSKPRHTIVVEARAKLGVSTSKMIEDIGFDDAFLRRIETDGKALESYPYDVLRIVANYLNLDPRELLCAPHK